MTKTYLEFIVQNFADEANADLFISSLAEIGFESFMQNDDFIHAWIQEKEFNNSDYLQCFNSFSNLKEIERKTIAPQNWNAMWEEQFDPIIIRNKICIRAPFHQKPDDSLLDIIIEPRMSFGTGHHSTTRLMCEILLDFPPKGNVMDMGCGTGILAIIALKTGALSAQGIEIEEDAVSNAKENAERNSSAATFYHGNATLLEVNTCDYFLANINRNIIQNDIAKYVQAMKSDAIIALSGFLLNDVDAIKDCCQKERLSFLRAYKEENWAALVFKK